MLLVPWRISRATRAVLRSRITPLLTARRKAKVQDRLTRGRTSRRRCCRAWNRSLKTSAVVRVRLREKPSGRATKRANVSGVWLEPRLRATLLIVTCDVGASPEKRLEIDTPPSARRPAPLLARLSMIAASAGRLATSTRPSSRSYQRNAGTPRQVPCRMPCWLAGVVQGSWTGHPSSPGEPGALHRRSVGIVPDWSAQLATG